MPDVDWWIVVLVACVLAFGWYLSYTAARLDRMHQRVHTTAAALDAALLRRAEASIELAREGDGDPASRVLLESAAREVLDAPDGWHPQRIALESSLTEILRHTISAASTRTEPPSRSAGAMESRARWTASQQGVIASQALHRQSVAEARETRHQLLVRVFHLAGHAPMPEHLDVELDVGDSATFPLD